MKRYEAWYQRIRSIIWDYGYLDMRTYGLPDPTAGKDNISGQEEYEGLPSRMSSEVR
jgi:hypothetical protein